MSGTGQERANRKIIEQLEEEKRRLKMANQGHTGDKPATVVPPPPTPISINHVTALAEPKHMNIAQRTALTHAQATSIGYFITQDSSFGNLILPVLPRFDKV